MRIRSFRLTDLPRVMQIERVSFGETSSGATTFLAHVLRDRKHSFVAEDEQGLIVGYTLARMNLGWLGARRGGITSIAVDPQRGVEEADLEVDANNRAAQSLYEASGFRRSRLLPHYYGPNRDGIRMVVDLTGSQCLGAGRVAR